MKIVLIALHFSEYASRLALSLCAHHSVQLHLCAPNAANELSDELFERLKKSVDLHLHPQHTRKHMLIHGARIAREIRRFKPDIIHAQEAAGWTLWSTLLQLYPKSAKLVLTVHDPSPHMGNDTQIRRRTQWVNTRLRLKADAIFVHGQHSVTGMNTVLPETATKVYSVGHGVLGHFVYNVTSNPNAYFLFFGRIQAYKGLGVLIEAAQILKERHLDFRLKIAGNGSDLDQYRDDIARMSFIDVEDRYIPQQDIPKLFENAKAIVMPYLEATQSGVAALAISARKPLIASAVGSIPEVIQHEENGLLVRPNDPTALADAMERLIKNADLCQKIGEGAAATAQTVLNWDTIAEQATQIYKSLLVASPIPSKDDLKE